MCVEIRRKNSATERTKPPDTLVYAVAQLVEALRYKPEGRGFDSRWCHGILLWHNPSLALGFTRGVKTAGVWGWQPYHLHVPIVTKFGSLNLLEPSGYVQVCNGVAWRALVCHLADPALIPGWSVWHLLRRTWHFHIFYHSNLVSVSFYQLSILIHSSITKATLPHQQATSLK